MKPKIIMAELYCPVLKDAALKTAVQRMCAHFGGCTEVYGAGSWVHPESGDVIHENVFIVRSAIAEDQANTLHSIAEQYKVESGEHTVMYSIGTEVFFI